MFSVLHGRPCQSHHKTLYSLQSARHGMPYKYSYGLGHTKTDNLSPSENHLYTGKRRFRIDYSADGFVPEMLRFSFAGLANLRRHP